MKSYRLAKLIWAMSPNDDKDHENVQCRLSVSVHATDVNLLAYILSIFNDLVQKDPANLRVLSGRYFHSISNTFEEHGEEVTHKTAMLDELAWEVLTRLGSLGWEPFSSDSGCAFPNNYTEQYSFRKSSGVS